MIMYKMIYSNPYSNRTLKVGELIKILESLDENKALFIVDESGKSRQIKDIAQSSGGILLCDF